MKILFDTNSLVFLANDSANKAVVEIFNNPKHEKYYSVASIWELVIKTMMNKVDLGVKIERFEEDLNVNGVRKLDISTRHIYGLQRLKDIHKDPFDRIMVSQAITEGMEFITSDDRLSAYSDCVRYFPKTK